MNYAKHPSWLDVKLFFRRSFYCSIASVNSQNLPHLTPIGSVILTSEAQGFFLIRFTQRLPENLKHSPYFSIMAVDTGIWFWLKSLFRGHFSYSPAIRLDCESIGLPRRATEDEQAKFLKKVRYLKFLKGYQILWTELNHLQEFKVLKIETVSAGKMTS